VAALGVIEHLDDGRSLEGRQGTAVANVPVDSDHLIAAAGNLRAQGVVLRGDRRLCFLGV
jgi:hypothetical protein